MSDSNREGLVELRQWGLQELRRKSGWYLGLGIALVILGTLALGSAVTMTIVSVLLFGAMMIVGGILQSAHAFVCKQTEGFFVELLTGILYLAVGIMTVARPAQSAEAITLLIAGMLFIGGLFRVAVSIATRFPHWGWMLLNGVISVVMAISIWHQWPLSGLWVIGLFVGVDMIFNGWSLIALGIVGRKLTGNRLESLSRT